MSDKPKIEPWLYPLKVEYDRRKVCECNPRTFILDYKNKLVYCSKCGAIIDPFEALMDMARNAERIQRALNANAELAQKEERKYRRYRGVNNVTEQHRRGMIPCCPECGKPIDPAYFTSYVSAKYGKGATSHD